MGAVASVTKPVVTFRKNAVTGSLMLWDASTSGFNSSPVQHMLDASSAL